MFNFEAYVMIVAVLAASFWFLIGMARLNNAWRISQVQTAGLRQQRADDAKALLTSVEELMKLNAEVKEARKRGNMLTQANEIKKDYLAGLAPSPPPAIYVTSEFPPSSRDRPWTAVLGRTTAPKSRRADEPGERLLLVWAPDQPLAQGRAQTAVTSRLGWGVGGVMRFM
jgi:hypothetical protein